MTRDARDPGIAAWARTLGLPENSPEDTVLRAIAAHYRRKGSPQKWRERWERRVPTREGERSIVSDALPKLSTRALRGKGGPHE